MAELISGPLLSLALIILAGIALRYALRSDRDRHSASERALPELRERISSLSMALEKAQQEQLVAQANFARASEDYETLKRSVDLREADWKAQRAAMSPKMALVDQLTAWKQSSEHELASLKTELEQVINQAHRAQQECSQLTLQIHQLEAANEQLSGELASTREAMGATQSQLQRDNEQLRSQVDAESNRIGELQRERTELLEAKEQLERECTALQLALNGAENEATRLLRHTSEMSEQTLQLEQMTVRNHELQGLLNESNAQVDQLSVELKAVHVQLDETRRLATLTKAENRFNGQLRRENGALGDALSKRDKQIADLAAAEALKQSQLTELRKQLAEYEAALHRSETELQKAVAKQEEFEKQSAQIEASAAKMKQQRTAFDDKLRIIETEKDELARGLQREQQNVSQLKQLLESESAKSRKMQFELSHFELLRRDHQAVLAELEELKQQHDQTLEQIEQTESQLRAKQEQFSSADVLVKRHEQELITERKSTKGLWDRNAQLETEIARVRSEKQAVEQLLAVHAETLQKLRADSMSIETLLERQAAVQSSLREHADRLRNVAADLRAEHHQSTLDEASDQVADVLTFARPAKAA